jgi:hypothetical protein
MAFKVKDLAGSILGEQGWLAVIGCAPQSLLPPDNDCRPTQPPTTRREPIDFVFGDLKTADEVRALRRALRDMMQTLAAREKELSSQEEAAEGKAGGGAASKQKARGPGKSRR